MAKSLRFGGKVGSKCKILFSEPPKGTSLRETTSFDVLIVKIGAGVLAVGWLKNQKKTSRVTRREFSRIWGSKGGNRIFMKFCVGVGVQDVVTHAHLGDDQFGGFKGSGVQFPTFLLTCVVVLKTLWHYRASVWYTFVYTVLWYSLIIHITSLELVARLIGYFIV